LLPDANAVPPIAFAYQSTTVPVGVEGGVAVTGGFDCPKQTCCGPPDVGASMVGHMQFGAVTLAVFVQLALDVAVKVILVPDGIPVTVPTPVPEL
jgi:hypothetical protein